MKDPPLNTSAPQQGQTPAPLWPLPSSPGAGHSVPHSCAAAALGVHRVTRQTWGMHLWPTVASGGCSLQQPAGTEGPAADAVPVLPQSQRSLRGARPPLLGSASGTATLSALSGHSSCTSGAGRFFQGGLLAATPPSLGCGRAPACDQVSDRAPRQAPRCPSFPVHTRAGSISVQPRPSACAGASLRFREMSLSDPLNPSRDLLCVLHVSLPQQVFIGHLL